MNASVAIQVLPGISEQKEMVRVIDEVIEFIKSTGVNYMVCPFETTMEGDYDKLMEIAAQCQKIAIKAGAPSVMSYLKINYKPDGEVMTIHEKVDKHS